MNNSDPYPHDTTKALEWHERRHEAVHDALSLAGIKGVWTHLAEDRVKLLVAERDEARESYRLLVEVNQRIAAERDAARNESAMLRTGDTCARLCEGTAYRIKARQMEAERDAACAEVARLKARIDKMDNSDPDPSRLEIAAMLMAYGWADRSQERNEKLVVAALKAADALIAGAKEVQK